MSLLRKQESRLLMPSKSPSPGLAFGQAGLSRQGRGQLLHPAKILQPNIFAGMDFSVCNYLAEYSNSAITLYN